METITIGGVVYTPIDSENTITEDYYIVRTYSAGVFFGKIKSRIGKEVIMNDARRLWYWSGAASLSDMSVHGVSKPDDCKFPCAVDGVLVTECIEILKCTQKAIRSLKSVKIWTMHE